MTGERLEQTSRFVPTEQTRAMNRTGIPRWEQAFAVVGLFLCLDAGIRTVRLLSGTLGPIQSLDPNQLGNYVAGSTLTQSLLFTVYFVSIVLLLTRPAGPLRRAGKTRLLWVLLLLAALSILWSDTPDVSLRRIVALLGSAIFGLYLATRYPRVALLRVLLGVSVVAMTLSIAICLALPAYGIDEFGAWQGVFALTLLANLRRAARTGVRCRPAPALSGIPRRVQPHRIVPGDVQYSRLGIVRRHHAPTSHRVGRT